SRYFVIMVFGGFRPSMCEVIAFSTAGPPFPCVLGSWVDIQKPYNHLFGGGGRPVTCWRHAARPEGSEGVCHLLPGPGHPRCTFFAQGQRRQFQCRASRRELHTEVRAMAGGVH